ncbi:MAG: wax ester/triacylglycerol synthase family O-acyltransferase [Nevskiaceae bacterium]|nr:MAG: wax ester/triacylglycerol synthase family O-acyltransferase [Nevskiaceae bacterium]
MKRLNPLDASWLAVESHDTPMHVANLQIFSLPPNVPDTFLRDLVARLKSERGFAPPWNLKLRSPTLGRLLPMWTTDDDLDLDYHVRHSALPAPGGERELGVLVSRLHSHQLDLKRPLWECHIIEGLENKRFALYTKMHHSLIDGVSGVRLLQRVLSTDPNDTEMPAPWTVQPARTPRVEREASTPSTESALQTLMNSLRAQAGTTGQMLKALTRVARGSRGDEHGLTGPFSGPASVLNRRVTGQRRFATQQYDLGKLKALAKASDCSLNDIVLYLSATALRRFMEEANTLPNKSLTAGIPVNVRPKDDQGTGNAISFIIANLATDIADPLRRLQAIKDSTAEAKEHLQSLPREAITQYTVLLMAPYMLQLLSGLGGRVRPVFNVTISNVPGPEQPLYFNGARLEAMYPVSLIAHGGALNITCLSYAGTLNFGFTGCRDTLPHMQRLAVYTGEALQELETLLLAPAKRKRA